MGRRATLLAQRHTNDVQAYRFLAIVDDCSASVAPADAVQFVTSHHVRCTRTQPEPSTARQLPAGVHSDS